MQNNEQSVEDVLKGEAGTDHFKIENDDVIFPEPVLENRPLFFPEHTIDDTRAAIVNELTIEPGLQGSLANAGIQSVKFQNSGLSGSSGSPRVLMVEDEADKKSRTDMALLLASLSAASGIDMTDPTKFLPKKFFRPRKHYDPKYDAKKAEEQKLHNQLLDEQRKAKKAFKDSIPRSERVLSKQNKK